MQEIIVLSIIQGITEFLPISSSSHLLLAAKYLNLATENLILDLSLHLGSLFAVIFFFKKEILNFIQNRSLFLKIITGSLPTLIAGFIFLKLGFIDELRNIHIIAFTTIFFGILLYFSDKSKEYKNISNNFNLKESLYIGLFQILSLIPGVSRSGITITTARFLNYSRVDAAKISFLLSIPTLSAVGLYNIIKIIEIKNIQITSHNLLAITLSFIISLIFLKVFMNFLKKFSLFFFVIYRILLGIIILFSLYV